MIGIALTYGAMALFVWRMYHPATSGSAVVPAAQTAQVSHIAQSVPVPATSDVTADAAPPTEATEAARSAEVAAENTPEANSTAVARTDPYRKTFTWTYRGRTYTLNVDLYGSLYGYYFNRPKVFTYYGTPPENWEEQYFRMFLETAPGDATIAVLARQLRDLGRAQGLSDDRIVELVAAFVQAIPYDTPKAQRILSTADLTGGTLVYPYETLWQNTGVYSDKSILLYALLHALGYGVALLTYDEQQHMAVGVQCPAAYASYPSGYCYIETTTPMPIGMIPSLDAKNNQATAPSLHTGAGGVFDAQRALGAVATYAATQGRVYTGVIQTHAIIKEINALQASIAAQKAKILSKEKKLNRIQRGIERMAEKLQKYKDREAYDKYNALVDPYNAALGDHEEERKKLIKRLDAYNHAIARYNELITLLQ